MSTESGEGWEYPHRDPERLRDLYHDDGLTLDEVADELDTTQQTVIRWMNRHGIERRSKREASKRSWERGQRPDPNADRPYRDEERLRRLYIEEELSTSEIGERLNCSNSTIQRHLKKFGIERRRPGKEPIQKSSIVRTLLDASDPVLSQPEISEILGISDRDTANRHLRELTEELGVACRKDVSGPYVYWIPESPPTETPWRDGDLLRRLYLEEELSTTTIGDVLGCSSKTVSNWLYRHKIPTRNDATKRWSKSD